MQTVVLMEKEVVRVTYYDMERNKTCEIKRVVSKDDPDGTPVMLGEVPTFGPRICEIEYK